MKKSIKRSTLQRMSDQDQAWVIEQAQIPATTSSSLPVFGWCSIERNCLKLQYISQSHAMIAKVVTLTNAGNAVVPDSDEPILAALSSMLAPLTTLTLGFQRVYALSKHPSGIVFSASDTSSNSLEFLNRLQQSLSLWLVRRECAEKVAHTRHHYKNQMAKYQCKLDQIHQDKHKLEKQMLYQLSHDSTTNMLNRAGLENALSASFNSTPIVSGEAYLSVILVQFTNGERVQARIGCEGLDELLKEFERKISDVTAQIHYFARISTTELALATVIPSFDEKSLPTLCKQIANIAKQGFFYQGQEVHLHSYMGVANSFHTQEPSQLIDNSFHAALACKESGELVSFYTQADQQNQKAFNQLEHYLLQAVRNDDLILYFQPKVDITSQKWVGAEVLLRWKHPVMGEMSNEALIHMAEQNGLIIEVGYFVLSNAIDRASEWAEFAPEFCLSINVSAKQICLPAFASKVAALLEQYELPAHNLELELTESSLVSNFDVAKANIDTLTSLGVKFALDDFGTGYASFNYLRKLPFSALKIDKEFLTNIFDNPQDKSIFRSISTIARKLNKQVIVEGVETQEQHLFITQEQCDVGQGFYYAKPMPRDIFEVELKKQYPPPDTFIIR
ncbi:putative bifunctional diguanylate cyclase/phosphodiesterase [Vibrio sp. 10N]|uniref:putative bifunctional diguanylate cyclase/phosphodiesterase n=1 Tax=Vibrio sp. 10N TaxID=3058938 RepID=UPI0030C6847A